MIGTLLPTAILLAFFGYLYREREREHLRQEIIRVKEQGDKYLASGQNDRAFERYDALLRWVGGADPGDADAKMALTIVKHSRDRLSPAIEARKERERGKIEALPFYVRDCLKPYITSVFGENGAIVDISDSEVRELRDARKIPWLWECTATVRLIHKREGIAPVTLSLMWRSLHRVTPGGDSATCWQQMTVPRDGSRKRVHFETSEWTADFRSEVGSGWSKAFEQYNQDLAETTKVSPKEQRDKVERIKEQVAKQFKITVEELDEILEASHSSARQVG